MIKQLNSVEIWSILSTTLYWIIHEVSCMASENDKNHRVRVAQYLRMSTDHQQYSLHNQVMLPTYWFSVWWCFWGAPVASVSISCPSCSATDGVVRNGKSTAGHQRYLCSHCRKTWQLQFTYTASQPGTHQKIIDMAMNGVGCRATARIMGVGLNTILRHLKNSGRSR